MNLELLESYGQNYPEEHDGNLDSSSDRGFHAISIWFLLKFPNLRAKWLSNLGTFLIIPEIVGTNTGKLTNYFQMKSLTSVALTCAFNRRGTLLAVGCNDGRIAIWDFLTRGIAKERFDFSLQIW